MKKLTYEYVKEQIEKEGYKLLSKKGIELLIIEKEDWIDNKTFCIKKVEEFVS